MADEPLPQARYFREQVLRKRPYIRLEWCEQAIHEPIFHGNSARWPHSALDFRRGTGKVSEGCHTGGWSNDPERIPR